MELPAKNSCKKLISALNPLSIICGKTTSVVSCGICYDDSSSVKIHREKHCHRHEYCEGCLTKYIDTQLQQGKHRIRCPGERCKKRLTIKDCNQFLPDDTVNRWSELTKEGRIPYSRRFYCPFPNCSKIVFELSKKEFIPAEITNRECPHCNRAFCAQCRVPWHDGISCQEVQTHSLSETDLMFLRLAEHRRWRICRRCKRVVEKSDGCDFIICRCNYTFCYRCGHDWNRGLGHIMHGCYYSTT